MKNHFILLFFGIFTCSLSAQVELEQLQTYFKNNVETVYIHTNKNKYVVGENLWFKAYTFNLSQNRPSLEAINAEVNIFNADKKLISSKKYVVTNGVFTGNFKIDSTFVGGKYYLQAHTDFMKKQGLDSHVQDFNIIDLSLEDEFDFVSNQLDLQILPEGGHAVYGLDSSFGIKLVNANGLGESFSADLLQDDKIIKKIKSNLFGHAKFKFKPKSNSSYQIKLITDKSILFTKKIEDIKQEGVTLQLNPLVPELLYVQLQKNYKKDRSNYSMVIHQLQKGIKIDLKFDADVSKVAIPKDKLFKGMNTIRIFKDNVPILERLYFEQTNDVVNYEGSIVETKDETNDSISLKLYFPYDSVQKMLSISVLPSETKAYTKKFNIISKFRLANHLKGGIENEAYYFGDNSLQKTHDLDLLLITQGWSKYAWKNMRNEEILVGLTRRNGLNYKVLLDEKPKSTDEFLLFHGSVFNKATATYIDKNTSEVEFPNMYPVVGEKLKFSYVNKAKSYKAPELSLKVQDFVIDTLLKGDLPLQQTTQLMESLNMNTMSEAFIDTDLLDEVIITTKKESKKEIPKTKVGEQYFEIDDKEILQSRSLAIFLTKRGFRVTDVQGQFNVTPLRQSSIGGGRGVAFFLDGAMLGDINFLSGAQLNQFESIIINKNGVGGGLMTPDGAIYLESRKSSFLGNQSNEMFTEIEVKEGYESTKQFYNPVYTNYDDLFFKNYGTLSWIPQILIGDNNHILEIIFKNPNFDYTLFVEGLDSDGKLYSYEINRKARQ